MSGLLVVPVGVQVRGEGWCCLWGVGSEGGRWGWGTCNKVGGVGYSYVWDLNLWLVVLDLCGWWLYSVSNDGVEAVELFPFPVVYGIVEDGVVEVFISESGDIAGVVGDVVDVLFKQFLVCV